MKQSVQNVQSQGKILQQVKHIPRYTLNIYIYRIAGFIYRMFHIADSQNIEV